jgi:hypothetical protein
VLELENHNFPNSLEAIQKELLCFKQYHTVEKPLKWVQTQFLQYYSEVHHTQFVGWG